MKTLFLTGYDANFRPLADITVPGMLFYAGWHDFDFHVLRSGPKGHPSWWKMHFLLTAFDIGYERVIWMDADMVITNVDFVPPGDYGYHCSRDWGVDAVEPWQVSNCCFAAFPDSKELIDWVFMNRNKYSQEFHEQNHMCEAARDLFRDTITVHPRRVFNAVPLEIHRSAPEPWMPGDWAAHLTMVDLKERVRLAKEMRGI